MTIVFWASLAALTLLGMRVRFGQSGTPLAVAYCATFVVAPLLSLLLYPDVARTHAFTIMVLAQLPFAAGAVAPRYATRGRPYLESRLTWNPTVAAALTVAFVVTAAATVATLRQITGSGQVTNAYDLNVAYSEARDGGSLGIVGRLGQLALPFAVLCFAAGRTSPDRRTRLLYLAFSMLFTLELVSVRRSTLFYAVACFVIMALATITSTRRLFRVLIGSVAVLCASLWFFGFLQVATHKSRYTSAWDSGIHEGASYVSGNLSYASYFGDGGSPLPRGNSFPNLFQMVDPSLRGAITKPFAALPDGQMFNTSPGYFDVWSDFGLFGLLTFCTALMWLGGRAAGGRMATLGSAALVLLPLTFLFRSNVLGEWIVLQSLVVYPVLVRLALVVSEWGTRAESESTERALSRHRKKEVRHAPSSARRPVPSAGRGVSRHPGAGAHPVPRGSTRQRRGDRTRHRLSLPQSRRQRG